MTTPLTTLQQYKKSANITTTAEDTRLDILINAVLAAVESYCDRNIISRTYTEYYSGNGRAFIVLNQRPVTSITSIYLDDNGFWGATSGGFSTSNLLTAGTDYALYIDTPEGYSASGMVYSRKGYWDVPTAYSPGLISPSYGPMNGNIKVTYVAGYLTLPADLQLAVNLSVSRIRNSTIYGQMVKEESYEEYAYKLAQPDNIDSALPPEAKAILARGYREIAIG